MAPIAFGPLLPDSKAAATSETPGLSPTQSYYRCSVNEIRSRYRIHIYIASYHDANAAPPRASAMQGNGFDTRCLTGLGLCHSRSDLNSYLSCPYLRPPRNSGGFQSSSGQNRRYVLSAGSFNLITAVFRLPYIWKYHSVVWQTPWYSQ
jgi:hypothetical protein